MSDAFVLALQDPNDKVVFAAIKALITIGDGSVNERLLQMLLHQSWTVRFYSCHALLDRGLVNDRIMDALGLLANEPEAQKHDQAVEDADRIFGTDQANASHQKINDVIAKAKKMMATDS